MSHHPRPISLGLILAVVGWASACQETPAASDGSPTPDIVATEVSGDADGSTKDDDWTHSETMSHSEIVEDTKTPDAADVADVTDGGETSGEDAGDVTETSGVEDALEDQVAPDGGLDLDAGAEVTDIQSDTEIDAAPVCSDTAQLELYTKRIEPLVSGNAISSCNQCHLAGVDLSIYVQGSPCETMACMVAQGFVDLDAPESSAVLAQILQAEPQSELITVEVIDEEYDGFLEWILYSAACHEEVCGDVADACSGGTSNSPNVPDGVATPLGSCAEEDLIELFDKRIYAWKGRCHGCHDDCDNEKWDAPCWLIDPGKEATAEELLEGASMSMYNLIGLNAFDPIEPMSSMALLKPMAESMGGVEHGGGDKFYDFADLAYQDFLVFALQYGACYQGIEPWWPIVTITKPKNKTKFYEGGEPPILQGGAYDPQDGPMTDSASYVWTRFVEDGEDEVLGSGQGPVEIAVPLGKHILTLTVTDSDGNAASRSVKVWMKTPQ